MASMGPRQSSDALPPLRMRRRRYGSATLEMALAMLVLLPITMGSIEFGYYFYAKHNLHAAARNGARAGIVSGAMETDVSNAVAITLEAAGLDQTGYQVVITNAQTGASLDVTTATAGTPVKVSVSCTWGAVGIRPLGVIKNEKTVTGVTVMRKE